MFPAPLGVTIQYHIQIFCKAIVHEQKSPSTKTEWKVAYI
nr:MAG TPA: hypothetical protein [Caudoviricetes sp.]